MARGFPVPRVVFSRCLGFEACRYNGQINASEAVEHFKRLFECVTPCPEKDIGLGVPRKSIRIVRRGDELRLVQPATGRDVSGEMRSYVSAFLDNLGPVDGFVLKSRSPSCGLTDTKLFQEADDGQVLPGRIAGFLGGAVLERYPATAVEDEGRLTNFTVREHFLTRVYTAVRFRALERKPTMAGLVRFQAENKLLFMGYNQTRMRELGRIVANPERLSTPEVFRKYGEVLPAVFARRPRAESAINVLMHGYGYFKDRVGAAEKKFFLTMLESYREGRVPLSAPQSVVGSWTVRFEEEYLAQQTFFQPYPEELQLISDSGKGRKTD